MFFSIDIILLDYYKRKRKRIWKKKEYCFLYFGHEAYEFVDILYENGMTYWNLLPICANNNLPYSPTSYYALEEDYISLDLLKEEGLIKDAEVRPSKDRAIYDDFKEKYYKEAFENFVKTDEN